MTQETRSQESFWPMFVLFIAVGVVLWGVFAIQPRKAETTAAALSATATPQPVAAEATVTATPLPAAATAVAVASAQQNISMLAPGDARAGEKLFQGICAACHGFNAMGISGLGKTLVHSAFVDGLTDAELVLFITQGREVTDPLNTTGVAMPARGGNPTLTDQDLMNVVAYIRSLNMGMAAMPNTSAPAATLSGPIVVEPFVAPDINALDINVIHPSSGPSGGLNLSLSSGEAAYIWACSGCHGADGRGVSTMAGSDLSASTLSGDALVEFLINGTAFNDMPTSYPHPARGGYPPLTDEQIGSLADYLSTLTSAS